MVVPSSIERIEPLPQTAVTLLNRIPSRIEDVPSLEDLLEGEPQLVNEMIEVALRAGRGWVGHRPDLAALVERIDRAELAEIAITVLVRGYLRRAISSSEDQPYWHYTLACALCCEQLAGPRQEGSLLAYAAGLLHDIGRLALIAAYPDRSANLLTLTDRMFASGEPFDILEHERLLFGLDHYATGVLVADGWNLPPWLRAMVGKFDDQAMGEYGKLVEIVRTGTQLAHSLGFGYLRAAPRANIRTILSRFPEARKHWTVLDNWQYGEEHMREKIQTRFTWYSSPAVKGEHGSAD